MEDMQVKPQKVFEELTKEERKLLWKEFNKSVGIRFKYYPWIGLGLLLPALISAGFCLYYMINILLKGVVVFQFYICSAIFTVGCAGWLWLMTRHQRKFSAWLKNCKNIEMRADIRNKPRL